MKTMKFFKKPALLLSIVVIAALLAVAAIAGVGYVANGENSADFGEQYAGVSVTTQGNVNLRFYFDDFGSADTVKYQVINPKNSEVASEGQFDVATIVDEGKKANGYPVTVPLYPSQMDYTVKVWMSGEGVDAAMAYEYSVEEYARDILAGNYTATQKDQMRALLNWGASAQSRFPEYSTKDALNANLYLRGTNPTYNVNTIPYTKGEVTYNGNAVDR